MSNILDRKFKYVKAADTNIRVTIRRVQREIEAKKRLEEANMVEVAAKVRTLKK